jgi:hypothetical protein
MLCVFVAFLEECERALNNAFFLSLVANAFVLWGFLYFQEFFGKNKYFASLNYFIALLWVRVNLLVITTQCSLVIFSDLFRNI